MPDRILITTDDLEQAVRINAGVEAAGFHTTLATTLDEARQALRRDPPPDCVVVTGGLHETGAAQLLTLARDRSPRRAKPFIAVNCAAIPDTLLESELFGHEKGAFTGAAERRLGRFELADGGTILLDEVAEMAPVTQVKVLRVLEDRTFFRVG